MEAIKEEPMSYYKAKDAFQDAKRYMNPTQDPVQWDMTVGLIELTQAVEADLQRIQEQIVALARLVSR
jgi:hypothetical protein